MPATALVPQPSARLSVRPASPRPPPPPWRVSLFGGVASFSAAPCPHRVRPSALLGLSPGGCRSHPPVRQPLWRRRRGLASTSDVVSLRRRLPPPSPPPLARQLFLEVGQALAPPASAFVSLSASYRCVSLVSLRPPCVSPVAPRAPPAPARQPFWRCGKL